ncbi:MAG TPA: ATP-binding cassette domain-containing protein [Anaerolineaceae bacterium]|nr:ATP-binding cassette domain-containing protein [Anaerolineaceae bacterium]
MNTPILEMKNITKQFPGVKALNNVSFRVNEGEIHCLVGENGAGKSTLMKVLSGVYPHGDYSGDIIYCGEVQKFSSTRDSEDAGIAIIYQELALIPELTVYENIFLGNEITKGIQIDWNETVRRADQMLKKVRLDINPATKIKDLGIGKQQLVEIAKALSHNVKLLVLDEPTSALNESDSENLLNIIRGLKDSGVTCIMISHKLKEVISIADTVTVLRDGQTVCTLDAHKGEVSEYVLIKYMVGREINNIYPDRKHARYEPRWMQDKTRFQNALNAAGYPVEILFSQGDSAREKANVESLISKNIKVLIICPQDAAAAGAAADEAHAAGIKVISYDRLITGSSSVDYYVTFDSISVGKAQGQYLVDHATGKGNPLYLYSGAASDNNAFLIFEGAWEVLQPKIADGTFVIKNSAQAVSLQSNATLTHDQESQIIGQITTNWDFTTAKILAESNLTAATAVDKGNVFVLAPNDGTARSIADAFAADKDVKSYVITGQDAEVASVQYIIDGKQSMTVFKDVRTLVKDAISTAVSILQGQTPKTTATYNNGKIDVPAIQSPVIVVDKSNVQSALIDSGYYQASQFTGFGAAPTASRAPAAPAATVAPVATGQLAVGIVLPMAMEEVILEVKNWNAYDPAIGRQILKNINFNMKKGEIVGLSGLMGSGRTELALSIFGNPAGYRIDGELDVKGKEMHFNDPRDAINAGIAYVTEDRKGEGLILIQDVKQNISLANLQELVKNGVVDKNAEIQVANEYKTSLNIKTPSVEQKVSNLSGGNQQKVCLGKWLFVKPDILILDEPTRGIDVGAKYEIYTIMTKLVEQGLSILMISSELPEILGMSDRVYVVSFGRITGELPIAEANQEKIMKLATD